MQPCVETGPKHPLGLLCPSPGYSKSREGHAAAACTAALQLLQVKPAALWGPTATSPPLVDGVFGRRLAAGFATAWKAWYRRNNVNINFFFLLVLHGTDNNLFLGSALPTETHS